MESVEPSSSKKTSSKPVKRYTTAQVLAEIYNDSDSDSRDENDEDSFDCAESVISEMQNEESEESTDDEIQQPAKKNAKQPQQGKK